MPIPLLAVQGGSLIGRDRSGPVTLTGSGALRAVPIDGTTGWLVEEATTNLAANPLAVNNSAGWSIYSGAIGSFLGGRTEVWEGGTVYNALCDGTASSQGLSASSASSLGITGEAASYIGAITLVGAGTVFVRIRVTYTDATFTEGDNTVVTLSASPQRIVALPAIANPAKTISFINVMARTVNLQAAEITGSLAQIEKKAYCTTLAAGSLGPGYAWTGPAHASASTRAASILTVPSGRMPLASGSVYASVLQPDSSLGTRYIFNASGTPERLAMYASAGGNQNMAASSGGTLKFATAGTFSAGPPRRHYGEWEPTVLRVRNATGGLSAAARDTPVGVLDQAVTIGGAPTFGWSNAPVGPVLIFDRPLTDAERATLDATPTALLGWDTLIDRVSGVLMVGQPGPMGVLQVGAGPVMGVR